MPPTAEASRDAGQGPRPRPTTRDVQRSPAGPRPAPEARADVGPLLGAAGGIGADPVANTLAAHGVSSPQAPVPVPLRRTGPRQDPAEHAPVQRTLTEPTSAPGGRTAPTPGHRRPPQPLVVARAVGPGRVGTRTPAPSAPRTLALLAARPLGVHTRAPEAAAASSGARAGRPPVVPASWSREPAPVPVPDTRRASATNPSAGPAAPRLPRTPAGPPSSASPHRSPALDAAPARPARAVPVVRPDAPVQRAVAGAGATGRPRALSVSGPQAPTLRDRPPAPLTSPVSSVPVVRADRMTSAAPGHGPAGPAVPVVQREVTGAEGVPAGVPVRSRQRSASAPPPAAWGKATTGRAAAVPAQEAGIDLDDLARRLLEPVSRLLRTDLRRGRERTGRPYDGRR
ncbi:MULTISPECIES: hypothetical protein [unclassified Streptomyces]|uniref:hypothetical protein n=1 Tax=unclassified Streptomyces TaxID=2593676 RepID=UPI002E28EE9C|nr:hypothetical protein [Streptomyces sp. NBC_00223]